MQNMVIRVVEFHVQSQISHSRFGHNFCSNLYGCAPRGPRGVKKSEFFLQIKLLSFCARIAPKRQKLRKIVKIEKKCQKTLFSQSISNILQFGGNISTPNLNWRVQWTLAHLLTPQGRIHIEYIKILVFVFDISEWWRPLQLFSTNSK